jgi:hypothetical protein
MYKLNIRGKNVLQTEAIYGMRVAAAHFHKTVVPAWIGEAPDLLGGFCDYAWLAEFIYEFHMLMGWP